MNLATLFIWTFFGSSCILFMSLIFLILIGGPVMIPYLQVKMQRGSMLLIMKNLKGRYRFVAADSTMHTKLYGDFLPNEAATFQIAGVSAALAYEGHAVPPSQEAAEAGVKLQEANAPVYSDLTVTANEAQKLGTLSKLDVSALYQYSAAINPHYVNSRIERRAAELLRQNRDNFSKVAAYVMLFIMVIIAAALGYYIISSGAGSGTGNAVSQAASSLSM